MNDTPQGSAAAMLARTKRIEIQHFADGGSVRRTTVKNFAKPAGAGATLAQMPASHAGAKRMQHGGAVHGPGGPTADAVPIWASAGEFMLPADTAAAVGKEKLQNLVDATHTPTNKAAEKMGRMARADGGAIDPGAVTRVGNSYSGGSVTGNVSINGAAPGGTVSTIDAYKVPPPPAAPPVLGAPAAVTPMAPKPVASPLATLPGAAPAAAAAPAPAVAPPPPPLDYANRNAAFNAGADARTAMMSAPGVRSSNLTAAPAAGTAAAALTARPVQSIASYADGGEIDDPRKLDPVPSFASPDAVAQALGGMAANARSDMQRAANVQLASLSPGAVSASSAPKPYVAEIPRGRYESAAPDPEPAAAAAPAPAPAVPAQAPAQAPAQPAQAEPVVAPAAPAPAAPTAQAKLAALPAPAASAPARANPLGGLADTNAQLANLQASNASIPQGGATIIDGAAAEADRRAQFNEQANLRNALNGSVMTRRGAAPNDVAVQAALLPIDARARMAQVTAKEAGDTQRAVIQERGTDARAKLADTRAQQELGINQQRLALEGKKITLDANRDDRAAAAAEPALALAQRKASLQSVVADPNSTPAQRQAAAQQIAGMEGKELVGHAPPAGYERTPDGNLKFIKGGPADPDTPKGKNNLTDTQAKALQFGSRMQEANAIFEQLEKGGKLFSTPGANNPITGGIVNQINTPAGQQLDQAKRNFVNAVLRRESGAAIAPSEFDSADKQYFPQPGDSAEVVQQKRANRELSMRGILAEVPDAETRIAKIRNPVPGTTGAAPAPQTPVPTVPAGMNRQIGTSGGKPVYEDANGRRFVAG